MSEPGVRIQKLLSAAEELDGAAVNSWGTIVGAAGNSWGTIVGAAGKKDVIRSTDTIALHITISQWIEITRYICILNAQYYL